MMFELTVNRQKHRLEINISGFVDLGLLVETESQLRDAVAAILRESPEFDMLAVLDSSGPASQEASAKMVDTFKDFLGGHLRKAAFVGIDPLAIMQIRRVTNHDPRFGFFADRAASEAWLDA